MYVTTMFYHRRFINSDFIYESLRTLERGSPCMSVNTMLYRVELLYLARQQYS
jgi:hypothetical protein